MRIIGVTGGVGCGKSTVLDLLEKTWQAMVLKADEVGHILQQQGTSCYEEILKAFGPEILDGEGRIYRPALSAIVFADAQKMAVLNKIMHPAIKQYILDRIREARASGVRLCVVEAALFFEDHYDDFVDEIWYIYADTDSRISRLMSSRGYSEEKCAAVMAAQYSEDIFRSRSDVVIDNSGSFEDTQSQIRKRVEHIYEIL